MQCVSDLAKLRDAITNRVRSLRTIVMHCSTPLTLHDKQSIAFAVIEMDNLVVVGLRQYAKSSLLGGRTAAGSRVTASVSPSTTEEAAAHIFSSLNPRGYANLGAPPVIAERNEIIVRDPKQIETVFKDFSASNLSNLNLALSLNAQVFSEAKICRHFFAHRARNTYEAVQRLGANLGLANVTDPEHFVMRGRPGTGVRLVDGWLSDIENFFDLAV